LLEPITDKGAALVESLTLEDATEDAVAKAREECKPPDPRSVDCTNIVKALDERWKDDAFWDSIANRCLSCGICVFLCPTCHCFDIQDTVCHEKGARCRVWDTCQFAAYTQHAGGHNPRPEKLNRTRNRVAHKFNYIPKNFDGMFGCVGCGRCITYCPVNIDLVEILTEVQK
jgi:ferredoxin